MGCRLSGGYIIISKSIEEAVSNSSIGNGYILSEGHLSEKKAVF